MKAAQLRIGATYHAYVGRGEYALVKLLEEQPIRVGSKNRSLWIVRKENGDLAEIRAVSNFIREIDLAMYKMAQLIADRLFTNGVGKRADRLVLTSKDGKDLGGWCEQAVVDEIEKALTKHKADY